MKKVVKYRENYQHLPKRFVEKIESDLQYLLDSGLPDLKKSLSFWQLGPRRGAQQQRCGSFSLHRAQAEGP